MKQVGLPLVYSVVVVLCLGTLKEQVASPSDQLFPVKPVVWYQLLVDEPTNDWVVFE